jgi:hypothetical protein
MREDIHYTDEDFQDYLDNNFKGDSSLLENHLRECELCSKSFTAYSSVWTFANDVLLVEPLKINLASAVTDKIFSKKESALVFEKAMYGIFFCLGAIYIFLCVRFLLPSVMPVPFALLVIPLMLFVWVNYKEIQMLRKKYALYLERS